MVHRKGIEMERYMEVRFESCSDNESFARVAVAAFLARLDPTIEEIDDVKTAVSEAVTNSVIHGYAGTIGEITIRVELSGKEVTVVVKDEGCGIADVTRAMEPFYTGMKGSERSGMGFSFMEAFMDELAVESEVGKGTTVMMKKRIGEKKYE